MGKDAFTAALRIQERICAPGENKKFPLVTRFVAVVFYMIAVIELNQNTLGHSFVFPVVEFCNDKSNSKDGRR